VDSNDSGPDTHLRQRQSYTDTNRSLIAVRFLKEDDTVPANCAGFNRLAKHAAQNRTRGFACVPESNPWICMRPRIEPVDLHAKPRTLVAFVQVDLAGSSFLACIGTGSIGRRMHWYGFDPKS